MTRVEVRVMLKPGVLDAQGLATAKALTGLGFESVHEVRQGKLIVLDLATDDPGTAAAEAKAMADKLLANPVIESYAVEVVRR